MSHALALQLMTRGWPSPRTGVAALQATALHQGRGQSAEEAGKAGVRMLHDILYAQPM